MPVAPVQVSVIIPQGTSGSPTGGEAKCTVWIQGMDVMGMSTQESGPLKLICSKGTY